MKPKEQAIKEIQNLVIDIYDKEFKWASWLFKKFIKKDKVLAYASVVMDISEKYVAAVIEEHVKNKPHQKNTYVPPPIYGPGTSRWKR